jgi:hypothetical protein
MDVEQIKVSKAQKLSVQFVGYGNRSTFYRWMGLLGIRPDRGAISKYDLALLCAFGKALNATGDKRLASRKLLAAKRQWTEEELYQFAFDPKSRFLPIGEKYAV